MSRHPRSGEAGKPVTIRATDAERERWETAAKHAGADLSAWMRQAANELAYAGKGRGRGWMRIERETAVRKRKRCPRCNQLLYVVNGDIERHKRPSPPFEECAAFCPKGKRSTSR